MIGFHKEKAHHRIRSSTVMHINIPYSSGNFTSNTKQSMSFKNLAIPALVTLRFVPNNSSKMSFFARTDIFFHSV